MEARRESPLLHTLKPLPQTTFNRIFALFYSFAILTLFYHHATTLLHSTNLLPFFITSTLFIADLVLAFMWINTQPFRMYPVTRQEFPENLEKVIKRSDLPSLDVFICTADPYKEPPIGVVNTALSVMAYDYPANKISVYVSDDGGSAFTLFAFFEAAKFARHWLPFCRENGLVDRNPEVFFKSNHISSHEAGNIKMMYESMKMKIEDVLKRGKIDDQYITEYHEREALKKWTGNFTRQDHPSVIQVVLNGSSDKDNSGELLPNLIYVSREKSKTAPHHFKAGALNVLLRVSASMTNAPIILCLDCDMYSNDPRTPYRALCYLCDPARPSDVAYVQFPQRFHGINKGDIYCGEYLRLFVIQPMGFDGLRGTTFVGTGCFFRRRAFFGGPSTLITPQIPELGPSHVVDKSIQSPSVLELAHQVARCTYERKDTNWGDKIGIRYGTLVEDCLTSVRLKSQGWRSIFCNPDRHAFLGDVPISLADSLNQQRRWAVGLLEVGICRYSPLTYGVKNMGLLMGLGYCLVSFWVLWSIPIIVYSFLPQLALLNQLSIFPKVSEPLFLLYVFLFVGSYAQDFLEFIFIGKSSALKWWNYQRMWHMRGVTCYLFGLMEFLLEKLGLPGFGFTVTSKLVDEEVRKRYEQGEFEFGVHTPMFVSLAVTSLINLMAFVQGVVEVSRGSNLDCLFVQMFIACFAVVNCWPVYKGMVLRTDNGKLPLQTTVIATSLALAFYVASSFVLSKYSTMNKILMFH